MTSTEEDILRELVKKFGDYQEHVFTELRLLYEYMYQLDLELKKRGIKIKVKGVS